jgi:hypothetical protein
LDHSAVHDLLPKVAHEPDRAALIQIKHQAGRLALANAEIIAQSSREEASARLIQRRTIATK